MTHVKEKRCARQNCSYRRRHGQKFNLGLSDIFKMVDRSGSVGHTHLHSARAMKLIGMQTRSDAITGGFIKNPVCLPDSEKSLLTEYVDIIGQPFGRHCREHLTAHMIDILVLTPLKSTAYSMCTEKCRTYGEREILTYACYDPQHLELIV